MYISTQPCSTAKGSLTLGFVVRKAENDRDAGGRLALSPGSYGDGPVVSHDVVGRPAIAPRGVGIGFHPEQELGAPASMCIWFSQILSLCHAEASHQLSSSGSHARCCLGLRFRIELAGAHAHVSCATPAPSLPQAEHRGLSPANGPGTSGYKFYSDRGEWRPCDGPIARGRPQRVAHLRHVRGIVQGPETELRSGAGDLHNL